MPSVDDDRPSQGAPQRRFYARPRPGESDEDFTKRFQDGFLAMVAQYRQEHPEFFEGGTTGDSPVETDSPRR